MKTVLKFGAFFILLAFSMWVYVVAASLTFPNGNAIGLVIFGCILHGLMFLAALNNYLSKKLDCKDAVDDYDEFQW